MPTAYSSPPCQSSPPQFQLLREWLRGCDQKHKCKGPRNYWPTRIIFIGGPDRNILKLVKKQDMGEDSTGGDYIALSHCWGSPTDEEKKRFCTTKRNYQHRLQGFNYDDLPKTFQDAVRATRELQKQYLWIDSLCIIQGDDGDWEKEAGEMEHVFSSAYCTIAASSASDCRDGFLEWDLDSQNIEIQDIRGGSTYTCDFNKDVDKGALSRRASVLQERVLSRRIIHFAAKQTYWECGEGVRCENFTRLRCPPKRQHFILDPNFPDRLHLSGYNRTVDFVRFLFKKYSRCDLTVKSDRDTAIIGLVNRVSTALRTEARYGILRCFFASLLLWKRSADEKTARIAYKGRTVPSWSWMAYFGGIHFLSNSKLKVPPRADLDFSSVDGALIVQVRQFEHCRMEREGEIHAIFADTKRVGSLWFDMAANIEFGHCVVVGMREKKKGDPQKTYCVLVVRRKQSGQEHERLGVGEVEARYVSRNCNAGTLW
ncbi:heterokaryon incompatibility protein-domain-containing protein [Dactylonectria estremocensis]|uniref:Heterokaryon incompatibility protein-domain-containing protein n=1 Tax=Dactylonectria estremocensis TaxID=1079267 RepID=A0A9P9IX85_9HYPO|nr:heterokaryon incompatibility protein-domain-containing protein [Dactylonectria estremocensis]